ncbi:MAG: aminomethyl-transferring glycine dehydrogenase subunit GcvPA, partial [Ruminiclostridium sp.]|nr:aminomethyl-transferring glycine dehydrogenase subunit GcvPA [Ruminiclostridium sp.]
MGSYIPATREERQNMLETIGLTSMDQLYSIVPEEALLKELNIPEGMSELEVSQKISAMADGNKQFRSIFRGAGAYNHFIPSIVKTVTSKEEFVTAYTPYQAEISQGILQSIFEYQTQVCELTGMDVSNASVYDGAVAAAEAVLMCQERKRSTVVVSGSADPQTIQVIKTYCGSRDVPVVVVPAVDCATDLEALKAAISKETAAVYVQSPNYYGVIEDMDAVVAATHEVGAKAIMGCNPISLGLLKTPGEYGADVAVCEGQPLGMPLSYGGPYLGYMATTNKYLRKLPGRIVGETADGEGRRAFCLALQAREQHIRREKASSNICSNQALCALTAGVYVSAMGPEGMTQAAKQSMAKAHYLASELCKIPGVSMKFTGEYFHEFVTEMPKA